MPGRQRHSRNQVHSGDRQGCVSSGKEGVNIERSVLAVWLGKSEYGRHRSEEHIPVDDALPDKTSVLILADDVVSK